jgi:5-methylcytosine-specific restriction protein A
MPERTLKPCAYPGCTVLVKRGRCSDHEVADTFVRDTERQRLYGRLWRQRRVSWLAEHPWCEDCREHDVYRAATDVHHVIRHEGDIEKFMTGPLQSLCHGCHSRKTVTEMQMSRNRRGG